MTDPRQVANLLAEGLSLTEIAQRLEGAGDGPSPAELAHAQATANLSAGATPPGPAPEMPAQVEMMRTFRQAKANGAPTSVAQRSALQKLFTRAVAGDESALFDRERWRHQEADRLSGAANLPGAYDPVVEY